ncbi:phage integrase [Reyranella soli]|uniref:Phage integrase n=1 Tax=Reyranella soli TaxID=1230389 RepID=A0A512NKJ2_9HYPH|nr:phage integrase [Reyranella soli]
MAKATKPGRWGDGDGLYLAVRDAQAKFWTFRYTPPGGKMREKGLGPVRLKTLAEARAEARELFRAHRAGLDPLAEDAAKRAALLASTTFKQEAESYIKRHSQGWRNAKATAQWGSTLKTYAYPTIGDLPVSDIDTPLMLKVLEPIWTTKNVTASRLRQRIEAILDAAKARGARSGDNPAAWKGNLQTLLTARARRVVKHHAALPYAEIGSFMEKLRKQPGVGARLLEFTILTACRTGETLGARWDEIEGAVWTIPAERMKGGRVHRVPLSKSALSLLNSLSNEGEYIFPSPRTDDKPLSNMAMSVLLQKRMRRDDITVHGFRSTFRDWAAEKTTYPREVAEMALAHAVGNAVEAAYRRGDLFEKRRRLMDDWARFCARLPIADNVTPLRRA